MSGHQPKDLTELAFASFTTYLKDETCQLLNWVKVSPTSIDEATKTCRELQDFFHGTRLPSVLANEITKRLLIKLDMFFDISEFTSKDYFRQILLTLVEFHMHPDVTSIELGPDHVQEFILLKVGCLHNLKTLTLVGGIETFLEDVQLVLPAQLEELALCDNWYFDNDNLKSIVECCRELKSLKIMKINTCPVISVSDIVKLNHLETLHLLGNFDNEQECVNLIKGISTDTTSDVLSASTLKSFGIRFEEENTLHILVDKLSHLTEMILELKNEFDLSCLKQLKNLQSLTLNARGRMSDDYKKILPVLGKSLVSLDLRSYYGLDLEFIGETCSKLQCLHVKASGTAGVSKASLKTFPNFRTVERLKVQMKSDYDSTEFIISHCVNIKVLSVYLPYQHTINENILKCISLAKLEEIHCYPGVSTDNDFLEELCLKCPNLRLVHGIGQYMYMDSFISGRVFDFRGCSKNFCKLDYSLPCVVYESDSDYGCTPDYDSESSFSS